jgi:hypothetical protein
MGFFLIISGAWDENRTRTYLKKYVILYTYKRHFVKGKKVGKK